MGSIIDLERTDKIYRCNHVKLAIVLISLILPPFSLAFLIFGIIRMIYAKKRKTFLTSLVILIFSSEIIQSISKLLQILKYAFDDDRDHKGDNIDFYLNARGIICQIQIVLTIYSDLCSLLTTLLISLRCYDVIKNKRRFFDKGKNAILSIILVIFISISFAIGLLFLDRGIVKGNISYRYDVRDRCSYWCWLEHISSFICFGLYWIVLILNIIYACKTNCNLKRGYKKLLEENQLLPSKVNNISTPLNEGSNDINENDKNNSADKEIKRKLINLTIEEKKRIDELNLMRIKCLIYPFVTIVIWLFAATYRIADDWFMFDFDNALDPYEGEKKEEDYFRKNGFIQFLVQFFLVMHTLLSSIRGFLYGVSFILFEEKVFNNFFRKFWEKYLKDKDFDICEDDKEILRNTSSSETSDSNEKNSKVEIKEDNYQNVEMNISNKDKDN